MYDNNIATVGELVAALADYDPATPLRIATQPNYPIEHTLARVVGHPIDDKYDPTPPAVLWLGVGEQIGYLPAPAANALGWS